MSDEESDFNLKVVSVGLIIFVGLMIFLFGIIFVQEDKENTSFCGDGTSYGNCSLNKPYFCDNGFLVERASVCGCSNILDIKDDLCVSEYYIFPKNLNLRYFLRGEENSINFVVYEGLADYISELPRSINYEGSEIPLRSDFKIRNINEENQRGALLPLVVQIQNIANDKEDQVRIAVSIVQNIPFGGSDKIVGFGSNLGVNYSRYPYEVLYEMQGVCGEKSELLAFLLRELGYEVVIFYYNEENHEAVGVRCPLENSVLNTEYCFIETSGISIISDDELEYAEEIRLYSEPEIIFISEGDSLGYDLYEYKDAEYLIRIRDKGVINYFDKYKLRKLQEKYALDESYNI
ncbi:MAG: hypothetical protein ABH811_00740 [archaeon]